MTGVFVAIPSSERLTHYHLGSALCYGKREMIDFKLTKILAVHAQLVLSCLLMLDSHKVRNISHNLIVIF